MSLTPRTDKIIADALSMPLTDWIGERIDNAEAIAATKTGEDRAGWLEDAAYLRNVLEILKKHLREGRHGEGAIGEQQPVSPDARRGVVAAGADAGHAAPGSASFISGGSNNG